MIVVADTSVILNLCRVRHEHLLPALFGRVLIPTEVASEFSRLAGAACPRASTGKRVNGRCAAAAFAVVSNPATTPKDKAA